MCQARIANDDHKPQSNQGSLNRPSAFLLGAFCYCSLQIRCFTVFREPPSALQRAPDYINALNNKGITLQKLGDLQASLSQHEAAKAAWDLALKLADRVLQLAPNRRKATELRERLQQRLEGTE